MAFSDDVILAAWKRAGGKCERCDTSLVWTLQGADFSGWRACRRSTWGTDVLANCLILCTNCQRQRAVRVK